MEQFHILSLVTDSAVSPECKYKTVGPPLVTRLLHQLLNEFALDDMHHFVKNSKDCFGHGNIQLLGPFQIEAS